jgi:SSS family solute:Na+ symporter
MDLSTLDIIVFIAFLVVVIAVSLYASRKEENEEDYFLAGRKLTWWLIGMSLIASNISSEHFVGMSGKGFTLGLAIASYEWMAAITLVLVGIFLLPRFLRAGIYTIPQYLEYRYNETARLTMAIFMLVFYIAVTLATVLYSGALALQLIFDTNIYTGIWALGILAGGYTVYGGLKAVVWSDLIQGGALLIAGVMVMFICFDEIGGYDKFVELAGDKLHTVLPWDHPEMPWVAVFIGGLWLPNIFYWGLNQFITQRTLGAKDLEEGQKGILFGATLKLIIPFIIVFPGIIAFELYGDVIAKGDNAYPYLIKNLLPQGLKGFMFAALFGAVMSTLDSLLNSASTIFTIDIYKPYFKKDATSKELVKMGRLVTFALVIFGCLWAPVVGQFDSLYDYIQKFWGLVQPGIVAAFAFGILWKKVPANAAIGAMWLNIPVYGACLLYDHFQPEGEKIAFLHYMAISFIILSLFMVVYTKLYPSTKVVVMPINPTIPLTTSPLVKVWSAVVVLLTVALYIWYW